MIGRNALLAIASKAGDLQTAIVLHRAARNRANELAALAAQQPRSPSALWMMAGDHTAALATIYVEQACRAAGLVQRLGGELDRDENATWAMQTLTALWGEGYGQ